MTCRGGFWIRKSASKSTFNGGFLKLPLRVVSGILIFGTSQNDQLLRSVFFHSKYF